MSRAKFSTLPALFFIALALAAEASACVCALTREGTHPCLLYRAASAVFVGQVIDIGPDTPIKQGEQTVYTTRDLVVRLSVEEGFRGVEGEVAQVYLMGTTCDFGFQKGERYFVYARRDAATQRLHVDSCSGTQPLQYAQRDLAYARGLARGEKDPDIFGGVWRQVRQGATDYVRTEGIPGIKVFLESGDHRAVVVTDADGRFEVAGLPPGQYKARIEIPENLHITYQTEPPLEVGEGHCSGLAFVVTSLAAITGRLVDAGGKPAPDVQVTLIPLDAEGRMITTEVEYPAHMENDGEYRFEPLSAGRYLVAINPKGTPRVGGSPYRKTFYPGASDASQATVITLAEGQEVKLDDFHLPPRLVETKVEGVALWPDGSPAREALVDLEFTDQQWREGYQRVDERGHFSFSCYEGFKYIVHAAGQRDGAPMHAEPVEITAGKKNQPVTLIIAQPGYDKK